MHIVILVYEEPDLRARFGESYEQYCAHVRRWAPGRSFKGSLEGGASIKGPCGSPALYDARDDAFARSQDFLAKMADEAIAAAGRVAFRPW